MDAEIVTLLLILVGSIVGVIAVIRAGYRCGALHGTSWGEY